MIINECDLSNDSSLSDIYEAVVNPHRKDRAWLVINRTNPLLRKDGKFVVDPWLIEQELEIIQQKNEVESSVILKCSRDIVNRIINAHIRQIFPTIDIGVSPDKSLGKYDAQPGLAAFYFEYFTDLCRGTITKQCKVASCGKHFVPNRQKQVFCSDQCKWVQYKRDKRAEMRKTKLNNQP